ncbi:hypothetical protein ACFQH6_15035 [Halobacteriaceae archaeon GCM10025711]
MQLEPHNQKDGYRVWLEPTEQDLLREYYEEDARRKLAISLMLHGLRSEEVPRVTKENVRSLVSEEEAYKLGIFGKDTTGKKKDGKWRETPIDRDTKQLIYTLAALPGMHKDDPVIDVGKRTVQRWVTEAAEELAAETGDDDWLELSAHDLRRSWATTVFYRLNGSDVAKSVIMRWGGWSNQQVFEQNYLGREPDELAAALMTKAGLR